MQIDVTVTERAGYQPANTMLVFSVFLLDFGFFWAVASPSSFSHSRLSTRDEAQIKAEALTSGRGSLYDSELHYHLSWMVSHYELPY